MGGAGKEGGWGGGGTVGGRHREEERELGGELRQSLRWSLRPAPGTAVMIQSTVKRTGAGTPPRNNRFYHI